MHVLHGTCVHPNPSLDNEPGPLGVAGIVGTSFMGSGNTMYCAETGTQVSLYYALVVLFWSSHGVQILSFGVTSMCMSTGTLESHSSGWV